MSSEGLGANAFIWVREDFRGKVLNKKLVDNEFPNEPPFDGSRIEFHQEASKISTIFACYLVFDTDDTTSILIYGGYAIAALWLTSAVVSAIDSIPLFPKFLEVVGLAYTLWFTYRYLFFKQNRDELAAKIEELKEQVLGSDDDD